MTFEEIKSSSKTWLSPTDISAVLETSWDFRYASLERERKFHDMHL